MQAVETIAGVVRDGGGAGASPAERRHQRLRGEYDGPMPPTAEWAEWVEFEQDMDGKLEGFTLVAVFDLRDGRIEIRPDSIGYRHDSMPLDRMGAQVLKDLRRGDDPIGTLLVCLERMGEIALPWVNAITAERKRPGRAGTPPIQLAEIAAKRVEADERCPRDAIRNMVLEWPDLFVSESAANAKVHKAKNAKGGAMLERGEDGKWQLTDRAVELLRDKTGEPT